MLDLVAIPSNEALKAPKMNHATVLDQKPTVFSKDANPASEGPLRPQSSVPSLSSEQADSPQREAESRSNGYLGAPPAHKQGETWSNTPLPDSPTLPMVVTGDRKTSGSQPMQDTPSRSSGSRSSSLMSRTYTSPNSTRPKSKNVRDLSIDTGLAARGKSTKKISHCAIQPPTPSNFGIKQTPSIAEVMNSPLPAASPASPSPGFQSNQKIEEIMDMFKQAYTPSPAISPHPTYETLQDAIIREINSHEAFQRVPVPEPGPPFTPSPTQESFNRDIGVPRTEGSNRTMSLRDSQLSKLRRGSFKKHRRRSDTRRSISTSVPSMAFWKASEAPRRRRHTDAPPPSPGFFNTLDQQRQSPGEQVTYMDQLLKSKKYPTSTTPERAPDISRSRSHSQSLRTMSLAGFSDEANLAPSVFHMRAQASPSSINSRFSVAADDSDEEVIELPSVEIPQVHIQGVDDNNVTYIAENTSPRNAFRLMSWPQRSGRSFSLKGNSYANESNNIPSRSPSRDDHTARSVASY
ncbi:hypothetical protein BBP40_003881 [Aspergillus hancockii]|nr:hypothetical protein BBP40_003881 [Aspergillus hancockii]